MPEREAVPRGITVSIPGRRRQLRLDCVVLDFNGTIAADGKLVPGVASRLVRLAKSVEVVVITADTFGTARRTMRDLPVAVRVIRAGAEKGRFAVARGGGRVVAVGNGVNDIPLFKAAALGIGVCGVEGASAELLRVSTVVVRNVVDALDLILQPKRLVATLRK